VSEKAKLWVIPLLISLRAATAQAQGPAPETAPTLFPGGGLVYYSSAFTTRGPMSVTSGGIPATSRPTFSHEADLNFTWGFYRDFDLALAIPVVTNHFGMAGAPVAHGSGLGDAMLLAKSRFYRRDSSRGTTQASLTLGPKFPTGRTWLTAANGKLLPMGLQPGSGSTDLFLAANWTCTGLFNIKRLVADEDFHALLRSQGSQATRLGSGLESRFWLSYRPYESMDGAREWFIGPVLRWLHTGDDRDSGVEEKSSGGEVLLAGITTYVGLRPGMHVWLGIDWDAAHSRGAEFMPVRRQVSFGITQQFRMHLVK
jgi:hypothetical protein